MTYEVGQHIDLRHINTKRVEVVPTRQKKSFPPNSIRTLYQVGTQFIFDKTTGKLALKIPVGVA